MLPAIGQALSIGSQAGSLMPAATSLANTATAAAGAAGAGAAGAGLMNLFKTPKGLAAFGQGIGAIGQVAGLMIGGEKGRDIAKQGAMFQLISGLAPSISDAFKSVPGTGTPLNKEATGGALKGVFEGYTPGIEMNPGETNLGYMGILGNTFA